MYRKGNKPIKAQTKKKKQRKKKKRIKTSLQDSTFKHWQSIRLDK